MRVADRTSTINKLCMDCITCYTGYLTALPYLTTDNVSIFIVPLKFSVSNAIHFYLLVHSVKSRCHYKRFLLQLIA